MSMDPLRTRVRQRIRYAYVAAVVIVGLSVVFDIGFLSGARWETFQRSGSATVIIAILLTRFFYAFWFPRKRHILDETIQRWLESTGDIVKEDVSEVTPERLDSVIEKTRQAAKKQISMARKKVFRKSARDVAKANFILLVNGTAIWGYGDLLPCIWNTW